MSERVHPADLPEELSLRQLVDVVAQTLDAMGVVPTDGRAARHPDARAVRYYVGLGLVDRPLGYRGNAALYGRRHALQLLAIKALQARGHGLPDVQRALLGRSDEELAAHLPARRFAPAPPTSAASPTPAGARWGLEIDLAPGVHVRLDAGALATLDPDRLAAALQRALRGVVSGTPSPSVPSNQENP